jgi:hypothetical protein
MKTARSFFVLILLFPFFVSPIPANPQRSNSATTYFQWYPGSETVKTPLTSKNGFLHQQGSYTVKGPQALSKTGATLLRFLIESEQILAQKYHLNPGPRRFEIPLIPRASLKGNDHQFPIFSKDHQTMVFPLPVGAEGTLKDSTNRFALFSLLHTIISANLAYGNPERLPVSSHAFRFIDGLSGFFALEIMENYAAADSASYLAIIEADHHRGELTRRFSAIQLLAQNSNSEDTDILAGLSQFFSGIGLTRDSEKASNLPDSSSTADRIRIFQWIQTHHGHETIANIIGYLSRSPHIWTIDEHTEDSFCRQYIHFGCRERTIDGTRSDIILQNTTGMNFAQLLLHSNQETEVEISNAESLPPFPRYGFDFPKAGGANKNVIDLHLLHDQTTISAGDVLEAETIARNGAALAFGIRDEAFQVQIQINYSSGKKTQDELLKINNIEEVVPQTIATTDLQIGSRVIESGYHSGWMNEIGVYFHWKRLKVEWDTRNVAGQKTQTEYINSGFFLLDIQNYKARMLSRTLTLGLNYDFQLGLVNQSGSTLIARDEKYNTDTSNLILGLNLGPELRLRISSLMLDMRLGGSADYLWQPMDDQGGKNGGDNNINASQHRVHLYATFGLSF